LVWARRLAFDRKGSIAIKFALAVPVIALISAGAIDLLAVSATKSQLQSIADNAALAGARSLTLAADKILAKQRPESFVKAEIGEWPGAPTYTAAYTVFDGKDSRNLKVTLNGHRPSFFGSMLPPGGWRFTVDATASPVGQTPLCAIGTGTGTNNLNAISAIGASQLSSPDCMVHSNSNILVKNTAWIKASAVQTVKGATGSGISPAAGQGAVPIEDPFASMAFPSLDTCKAQNPNPGQGNPIIYADNKTHYLAPGLHCFPIEVRNAKVLVLQPGEHLFYKNFSLIGRGKLRGDDVFLFFDHGSNSTFSGPWIGIDLGGRKSGTYAGMVMATIAGNQNISLPGSQVSRLLGVVYVRNGFLGVNGQGVAAEASDWTVVVAREIRLQQNASLRINANYEDSDVPVPAGVGPNGGIMTGTRLTN
jgi:hypothetical protein